MNAKFFGTGLVLLFLALSVLQDARATEWTVGTSAWNIASNWNGGLPGVSASAVINNAGTATVGVGVSGTYRFLFSGSTGTGTATLSGGSLSGTSSYLGYLAGSKGTVNISSGLWSNSLEINVGRSGVGTMNLTGGTVTAQNSYIGFASTSSGTVTVSNNGIWNTSQYLITGYSGVGNLAISGGSVTNTYGYIGYEAGSRGSVSVGGGIWDTTANLVVGSSGTGTLTVSGGNVTSAFTDIGYVAGSRGTLTVTSGTWSNSSSVIVGTEGSGALNVAGGRVDVGGQFVVGGSATAVGTVTVSGSNGNRGVLSVNRIEKGAGIGTLSVNGGVLQAKGNQSDFLSGFGAGAVIITGDGALIDTGVYSVGIGAPLGGNGVLTKQGAGTLNLTGNNGYTGGTVVTGGTLWASGNNALGTGGVRVQAGTLLIGSGVQVGNDLILSGGNLQRELAAGAALAGTVRSELSGGTNTTASFLSGTASASGSQLMTFSATSSAVNDVIRLSDAFNLTNPEGPSTNLFTLQLSITNVDGDDFLGWLDGSGTWVNAVLGNSGGTLSFQGDRAYNPATDFVLGYYGVDTNTGTIWAVVNHNGNFAVVPEPGTLGAICFGGLILTMLRRRKR